MVRHGTNSRVDIFADQCVVIDVDIGKGVQDYDRNFSLAIICIDGMLSTKDKPRRTDVGRSHCYIGFETAKNIAFSNRLILVMQLVEHDTQRVGGSSIQASASVNWGWRVHDDGGGGSSSHRKSVCSMRAENRIDRISFKEQKEKAMRER